MYKYCSDLGDYIYCDWPTCEGCEYKKEDAKIADDETAIY